MIKEKIGLGLKLHFPLDLFVIHSIFIDIDCFLFGSR